MNSRYQNLHTLGTLALILAWVLLAIGIVGAIGGWISLGGLARTLNLPGTLALSVVVPSLLFGLSSFLQFFILGKVLQLLVGMDDTTMTISQEVRKQQQVLTAALPTEQ